MKLDLDSSRYIQSGVVRVIGNVRSILMDRNVGRKND